MEKILSVPLDDSLVERLENISVRAGVAVSELVSDAIARHLADLENYYLSIHELRSVRLDHPQNPLAAPEVREYLDLNGERPA
ncbi:hypothetical protein [Rothia sp. ZJ932]|uniref:hypothetical protein n=1 Tax=Rothia sp. ZJ932 TaxID=2810516 RepID=UPI0019679552|nr:hypothetical protein [Rothia sp. ZJ932]QRZ61691.1 hypothetical protein JR346_00655 [Rothia sp. ZJ932]